MEHDIINSDNILDNLGKIAFTVDKSYLNYLEKDYFCIPFSQINTYEDNSHNTTDLISYDSNIRGIQIKKWIYNKKESIGDCLKNVLSTFSDGDHTLAFVVSRTTCNTEMYFVIKNEGPGRNEDSKSNGNLLVDSLKGNFQGSIIEEIDIEKQGKDIVIGFNPRFVLDALKVIDEEDIDMYLVNPRSPLYIKDENERYVYMILPINLS